MFTPKEVRYTVPGTDVEVVLMQDQDGDMEIGITDETGRVCFSLSPSQDSETLEKLGFPTKPFEYETERRGDLDKPHTQEV